MSSRIQINPRVINGKLEIRLTDCCRVGLQAKYWKCINYKHFMTMTFIEEWCFVNLWVKSPPSLTFGQIPVSTINIHFFLKEMLADKNALSMCGRHTNTHQLFKLTSTVCSARVCWRIFLQTLVSKCFFPHGKAPFVWIWLNQHFPSRWKSQGGLVNWSARAPDLNPFDYYPSDYYYQYYWCHRNR